MTGRPSRRSRQWRPSPTLRPGVLLGGGLAVQLAPVLLLPVVLTQDGPAHVNGAWVLLHHDDPGVVGASLRESYAVDLTPVPNMLTTLVLAGLLGVMGPGAAEKTVVAGFVVALVAALRYALRGVDRSAGWLAVAALPLAGGQLVALGFYNFCWGVALALLAIGLALRRRAGWRLRHTTGVALLLTLTWSTHLLPWTVAVCVLGALAVGRWAAAVRAGAGRGAAAAGHLLVPLTAVLPSGVLTVAYVARSDAGPGAAVGWDPLGRVWWLLTLYRPLVVSSRWELLPAAAVAVVLAALVVVALRRRPVPDGSSPGAPEPTGIGTDRAVLGTASLVALATVLLSPRRLGDDYGFLPDRLAWFPPLLLVLFCATRPPAASWRRAAAVVLVAAATAGALIRVPTQVADARVAHELLSVAGSLAPGSTFAVLRFAGHEATTAPLDGEPDPLRHLSSRLAVEAGAVDLGHYEAVYPYFQVRFRGDPSVREAIDPGLDGLDAVPPWVRLPAAAGRLQYVLVMGLDRAEPRVRSAPRTAGVLADLRAGYQQVAASGPTGEVTVWRLRKPSVDRLAAQATDVDTRVGGGPRSHGGPSAPQSP